jgi:hypothetical protein
MYLEQIVKDAMFQRLGIYPSPAQIQHYLVKFDEKKNLEADICGDTDQAFIEALKAGSKAEKKSRKNKAKPGENTKSKGQIDQSSSTSETTELV